jgi:hypothetical protein
MPSPIRPNWRNAGWLSKLSRSKSGVFANQLDLDRIQGAEGFSTFKALHFEIVANRWNQQREVNSIGRGDIRLSSCFSMARP